MMPNAIGQLFEHNGKLAQWRGYRREYDAVKERAYVVDKVAVSALAAAEWPHVLGKIPNGHDWSGYVNTLPLALNTYVDTRTWTIREAITEIKRPANTKRYRYEWSVVSMEWIRKSWDVRCVCGDYHNPQLEPCETCGACHHPRTKCRV